MQTTLLGVAIAFIVALVAALIGPHFIDWNQFRPQFEAAAARIVGAPVRVHGDMRATLLPTPSLKLQNVEIGGGELGRASAERLGVEFNLGALMRGEWRATELTINGSTLDFGLDWRGRIAWPAGMGGIDLSALAIDRLNVTGRVALHDGASRTTLELEDIAFAGDVRALAGALRGEGNASIDGVRYPFRISSNPAGNGEGMRLRLVVASSAGALNADLDGVLRFAASVPQFDGALTLERPAAKAAAADVRPWRIATKVKADPAAARFEQVELGYGPDDAALKFAGHADMRFGASPQLNATLAGRQLNADRLLARGDGDVADVLPALQRFVAALPSAPLPVNVAVSAEAVTLGGRPVQEPSVALRGDTAGWSLDRLAGVLPGATQVTIGDALLRAGPESAFSGMVDIAANDPDALITWLRGRSDPAAARLTQPLRASGRVSVDASRVAIEDLKASVEGDSVSGRVVLSGRDSAQGAHLDAALTAQRLDLDAAAAMIRGLAGGPMRWPAEARLSLDIAHAIVAGQEVRPITVRLDAGRDAIRLERLTFGAAGGVAVEGSGAFDRRAKTGTLAVDAKAASLEQVAALLTPLAPVFAERLKQLPDAKAAARLKLTATLEKDAAQAGHSAVRAALDIAAAPLNGKVKTSALLPAGALDVIDANIWRQSELSAEARLAATSSSPLLTMLGLDGVLASATGAATLEASANGAPDKPLRVAARLAGRGLDASATGTAEPFAGHPAAALDVTLRQGDLAPLLGVPAAVTLSSRVALSSDGAVLDDIDALIGGARLRGKLSWSGSGVRALEGDIGLDALNIPAVFAYAFGERASDAPLANLGRLQGWRGRVAFAALRATLPGGGELRPFKGVVRADGQSLTLDALSGGIGGGSVAADFDTRQTSEGSLVNARMTLTNVDGAALRYRALAMPAGRISLQATLASRGRSARAMLGALSGSGAVTLEDAAIKGLDPRAFDVALRTGEGKQAVNEDTLKAGVGEALAAGPLKAAKVEVPFNVKDGQLRAGPATLDGSGAQAIVSGGYDFNADQIDIRVALASTTHGAAANRPDLSLFVHGTPDAPRAMLDVSSLSSWLALRAIERETQRLDAIERGDATARAAPPQAPVSPAPPRPAEPSVAPATAPVRPEPPPRPRPTSSETHAAPPPPAAAPLPPPIEVRPAPNPSAAPRPRAPMVLTPPAAMPR